MFISKQLSTCLLTFSCLLTGIQQNAGQIQQVNPTIDLIIEKIAALENVKDPKCYATANRLEDFMYGSPLTDEARLLKFDIQKEVASYLLSEANKHARLADKDSISRDDIIQSVATLVSLSKSHVGDYVMAWGANEIAIKSNDIRQYSSVAYIYRVLLSVKQDLLFGTETILPISSKAVDQLTEYLNVMTLAALQLADQLARKDQELSVSASNMKESWTNLLKNKHRSKPATNQSLTRSPNVTDHRIIRSIIEQKLKSYQTYNQLNTKVFLRNIQVFFAKQKWPKSEAESKQLKNYFLESLISFGSSLLTEAQSVTMKQKQQIIRLRHVHEALNRFMPFTVNQFEDVTFYPLHQEHAITIESYDLDAFRDSGIHWKVLEFALNDADNSQLTLDPQAAELAVEGIAQLGVLSLRLAGQVSHRKGHPHLMISDLDSAYHTIQHLISTYDVKEIQLSQHSNSIRSAPQNNDVGLDHVFSEVADQIGIHFYHKSADWLSRFIRGYVYKADENLARLAIPPAFGGAGIAAEDLNNDHFIDLLILGGQGNQLLMNQGDGSFKDVSLEVGINNWNQEINSFGEPRQPIIVDFDNDGWQDIFISYVNGSHQMFRNIDGNSFKNVSHVCNLSGTNAVAGPATAFDYNNDGLLDLYIGYFGNYLEGIFPTLSRTNQNGMANKLYKNLGQFQFEEVDYLADESTDNGWTQALGHSDINGDGMQDIIVGNDFGVNRYYLNKGKQGFVDMSPIWKTDKPSYTMNVGIADLNHDAFPDFYISNIVIMQKDEKYVVPNEETIMKFDPEKMANIRTLEANDLFISKVANDVLAGYDLSKQVGPGFSSTGWSWDADFFDFDNDGDEDLYCLNGMNDFSVYSSENEYYVNPDSATSVTYAKSHREENVFFVNENGRLVNRAKRLGVNLLSNARSATYLDYDRDGDLDIAINNYHERAAFLKNEMNANNNWIKIKLVGDPDQHVNLDAIGATVTLSSKSFPSLWREIHSTNGYLSGHPKIQHFGVGQDAMVNIKVVWPNGKVVSLENIAVNQDYQLMFPDHLLPLD